MSTVRSFLKRLSVELFLLGDRLGVHVLPKHFYTPLPNYRWLRENKALWTGRASLTGVHWDLEEQVRWLRNVCSPYYSEVRGLSFFRQLATTGIGAGFGPIESQVLHCFIRATCPANVIEIGSGVSTACILNAVQLNRQEGRRGSHVTCIEPYPKRGFARLKGITHIRELVQAVPLSLFRALEAGDLLFVDSSHAVKTGSDTARIYLEVIGNLAPGVFIHIHDVTLPYLYDPDVLSHYMAWQETVLLLALLTHNPHLCVLACESALHNDRKEALAGILADYRPRALVEGLGATRGSVEGDHFPSSMWLRTR
jgi:hypothetical protein